MRRASWQPWTSYQIRKIAGCACAGNAGNVFPRRRFQRKPLVSDPGMHHGTCVTHVPWCMSGSLTCGDGENVPGIPSACAPAILRMWQEAHATEAPVKYHVNTTLLTHNPTALTQCEFFVTQPPPRQHKMGQLLLLWVEYWRTVHVFMKINGTFE